MKAGFVAAATAAAVALLPASAGAAVVTPDVVKPSVVTPQVATPAPAPTPAAEATPEPDSAPTPAPEPPAPSGERPQQVAELWPPAKGVGRTGGYEGPPYSTNEWRRGYENLQHDNEEGFQQIMSEPLETWSNAGIVDAMITRVVFVHGAVAILKEVLDSVPADAKIEPLYPNSGLPEHPNQSDPEAQDPPEPNSSPAPEPSAEEDCQCSLLEGGGGARPLDDQLDQEEE